MTEIKHPIILENPATYAVVRFFLKKFGLSIANRHVFLCSRETCEIDEYVKIINHTEKPSSEHFICLFSLDKVNGLVPIVPVQDMKRYVTEQSWQDDSEKTLKEVIKENYIKPDFVITFGRLEMPGGISDTCWAIHEFLTWKDDKNEEHEGIFDSKAIVPETVEMFTNYLWEVLLDMVNKPTETKSLEASEKIDNEEPVALGEVFIMESALLTVLEKMPIDKQKQFTICFCKKNKKFHELVNKISSWDKNCLKRFILANDVLNDFDEYREKIAQAMTEIMGNNELFLEE